MSQIIDTQESAEEIAARQRNIRKADIARRFKEIEGEQFRSMAAIVGGDATDYDKNKFANFENEKAQLRAELAEMGAAE